MNHQKKLFIFQILSELAIPLIGYFFWNWSLFFILIFYIIENLFLYYFRLETIHQVKLGVLKMRVKRDYKKMSVSFVFWLLEFILIHLFIITINANASISREWYNFIMYQDLGIPQGVVLIPLMYFASRMKMKQDILLIVNKLNEPNDVSKIKINFSYSLIAIGFWGLIIGVNLTFNLGEVLNLISILLLLLFRSLQRMNQ
jgi:hypothetical protein